MRVARGPRPFALLLLAVAVAFHCGLFNIGGEGQGTITEVRDGQHGGTPLGWATYGSVHGYRCKTGDFAGAVEALLIARSWFGLQ